MITEYKLEDAGREMLITVKRSSRKTLGLEVRENGEIFARIPEKLSDRSLKSFIEKERDWIIKKSELVKWAVLQLEIRKPGGEAVVQKAI